MGIHQLSTYSTFFLECHRTQHTSLPQLLSQKADTMGTLAIARELVSGRQCWHKRNSPACGGRVGEKDRRSYADKKGKRHSSVFPSDDALEDVIARLLEKSTQRPGWPEKYAEQVPDEVVDEAISLCSPARVGDDWLLIIKPDGDGYRFLDIPTALARGLRFAVPNGFSFQSSDQPIPLLELTQRDGPLVASKDQAQYGKRPPDGAIDEYLSIVTSAHAGDNWLLMIKLDGDGYRIFDATSGFARQSRVVASDALSSPESELPISLLDFAQRGGKLVGHKDPVQAVVGEQLKKIKNTMRGNRPGAETGMMAIRLLMAEVWPRIQHIAQQEARRGD